MATPAEIRQAVDDRLTVLWAQIRTRQAVYLANKGKYWQGIRTPAVRPADGALAAPNPALKPTDQTETWAGAGIALNGAEPMTIRIDTYDGPLGKGFTGTAEVTIGGVTWTRTANDGPETWRAYAWRQEA